MTKPTKTRVMSGHNEGEAIPIRLFCPQCGKLHLDVGEWATRLHHTHACQHCGEVWRPAVVYTVGVRFLPGFRNSPPAETSPVEGPSEPLEASGGVQAPTPQTTPKTPLEVCHCDHLKTDHTSTPGGNQPHTGSCSKVFCNCKRFQARK